MAQLNQEFENLAMMANQERITANAIHLAYDRERAIRAYAHPAMEELNPCIIRPEMQPTTFELMPLMFQMLQTIWAISWTTVGRSPPTPKIIFGS